MKKKILEYLSSLPWPQQTLNTRDSLLRSTVFDAKITNCGNSQSIISTLRSSVLCISPVLVSECHHLLQQKTASTRLVVARILSAVSYSLHEDTAKVCTSPPPPDVELTPAAREEIELRGNLYLLKAKGFECANLDWRHYVVSIWSNRCPMLDTIIREHPSAPLRSVVRGARLSRSVSEELTKDEVSEVVHLLRTIVDADIYVVIYLQFDHFIECFDAPYNDGYVVMSRPYVCVFNF